MVVATETIYRGWLQLPDAAERDCEVVNDSSKAVLAVSMDRRDEQSEPPFKHRKYLDGTKTGASSTPNKHGRSLLMSIGVRVEFVNLIQARVWNLGSLKMMPRKAISLRRNANTDASGDGGSP